MTGRGPRSLSGLGALVVIAVLGIPACARSPAETRDVARPADSSAVTAAPETTTTTTPPPRSTTVDVTLENYGIAISTTEVPAGTVRFAAVNRDRAPHDVVVVATDRPLEDLPTSGIRVDEQSPALSILGRTATVGRGGTADLELALPRGRYVLVCTVPHHYVRESMATVLSVV